MKNKYIFVAFLLAVILAVGAGLTCVSLRRNSGGSEEEKQLTVVTSFYPMYIAAENVIGDTEDVNLQNLSEPQTGCLHDYQLTAEDMKLLSNADVFIVNGGGIETFLTDVAKSYPNLTIINACENVELSGDNAHAWMSMTDYMTQVETICEGLQAADEKDAQIFSDNADCYITKVERLQDEYADTISELQGQPVILFHEAYQYIADEYGMNVVDVMDLDEERQVSAGEIADIISEIREDDVKLIFAEELYGKDMGDMVEEETGVTVLYLNTLTRGDYDSDSYLDGMRENLQAVTEFLNETK